MPFIVSSAWAWMLGRNVNDGWLIVLWWIGIFTGPICASIAKTRGHLAKQGFVLFVLYIVLGASSCYVNINMNDNEPSALFAKTQTDYVAISSRQGQGASHDHGITPNEQEYRTYSKDTYRGTELTNKSYKYVQSTCPDDSFIGRIPERGSAYWHKIGLIATTPGWITIPG